MSHISEVNASTKSRSYAWKRQYTDEIVFSKHLKIPDKIVALALLHFMNRRAGATCVDPLTLANKLGIDLDVVRASIERLVADRHLKVAGRYLVPLLHSNSVDDYYLGAGATVDYVDVDFMFGREASIRGDKSYYERRGDLIEMVLFNRSLKPIGRLIGIGTALLCDSNFRCTRNQTRTL